MKQIIYLAFTCCILFGCKKKLTQFYIENNSSAIIPAAAVVNTPFNILTPEMENNYEQEFESNDSKKKFIETLTLTNLTLKIKSPDNFTFSFLDEIEIFINADDLPEVSIASKFNISDGIGNELICDLTDINLKEYIQKDAFSLRLRTVTDEFFSQDVEIDIFTEFFVDAKLL